MRDVAIVGTGITRFGKFPEATLKTLGSQAIGGALEDAGVGAADVRAAFAANAIGGLITGQEMVRGQVVLRALGFGGIPVVNVENACAGGATALHLGWMGIASGQYDVALVYGVEKMTHPDKRRTIMAIATGLDVDEPVDAGSPSPFMDHYAERVRWFMTETGTTEEDIARVAVKAQRNGARNPVAQYGDKDAKVEDIMASPMVAEPLRRLMCSPIGDGAAALILASADRAASMDSGQPIWIRGSALNMGSDVDQAPQAIARSARAAYEISGIGPEELDVVELHDANAASEIMRYESLGLAAPGEGNQLVREGATALGGRLPVNPSGGLIARGHPVGATGCAQIVELAAQLRGRAGDRQVEGARIALAENGGGYVRGDVAADAVHILSR